MKMVGVMPLSFFIVTKPTYGTRGVVRVVLTGMIRVFKITGWVAMMISAFLIALVSFRYFILSPEAASGPQFGKRFAEYITPLLFHAGGGIVALCLGPWGFWGALRNKFLSLHRWMGRIYLLAVLVGGIAGIYMAATAFGGPPTRIGFGMLGMLWLGTGGMAYLHIRRRNFQVHREWMIRNYALTFAAVMLRIWLPVLSALGYGFPKAYMTVAWISWIPNLLVAEMMIRLGKTLTPRRQAELRAATAHAA